MSDEELAEIEEWFRIGTIYGFTKQGSVEAAGKAHSLIAEVRRLKAENENLQGELIDEKAYAKELRENFGEAGMY